MYSVTSLSLRPLAIAALAAVTLLPAVFAQSNPATIPVTRNTWVEQSSRQNRDAKSAQPQVAFIGDSITAGWSGNGRPVWNERFAALPSSNFGIGGDRTEHVLWRLQNGAFSGISPKVVVVMIGTNNAWRDSSADIADGVQAVVEEIGKQAPQAKILLLGIFPRDEKPGGERREVVAGVNEIIKKLGNDEKVFYMDISDKFMEADGTISKNIMPDFLHLSRQGYTIWADAIEGKIKELLQ